MPRCRYCQHEIMWVKSDETGKRIPLDARPTTAFQRTGAETAKPVQVYINHFVTCEHRDKARADKVTKDATEKRAADDYGNRILSGLCECIRPVITSDKLRGTVCRECRKRVRNLDDLCPNCHKRYGKSACGQLHSALKERIIEVNAARAAAADAQQETET